MYQYAAQNITYSPCPAHKPKQFSDNRRYNHIFWTIKNYYRVHICCL